MSRTSRVPYHQNVYDLLQFELLEPEVGESPEAARMIAEHEARHGPLPAAVREWYLVPEVVPLETTWENWRDAERLTAGKLWAEFGNEFPEPLSHVLAAFASMPGRPDFPYILLTRDNCHVGYGCWLELIGTDDPPVWGDSCGESDPSQWYGLAASFSDFTIMTIAQPYTDTNVPYSFNGPRARERGAKPFPKPHANGLWLRASAEPFAPPVIDFLIEELHEPERASRPGNVTSYTFRPEGGIIRITADEPALTGGLSAWWIHANTPERLAEIVRPILPFGTLGETLRADTDAARAVLGGARS